jgi:threonyl-tRNA synthetase
VEKKMKNIITQRQDFRRFETNYTDAKQILKAMDEDFKEELVKRFESGDFKNTEKLSDKISFYINISKGKNSLYYEKLQNYLDTNNFFNFDEKD